jgi:hypothetical protein
MSAQAETVNSIALNSNALTDLPRSLELISRLRYLNLRANAFTVFPAVVSLMKRVCRVCAYLWCPIP